MSDDTEISVGIGSRSVAYADSLQKMGVDTIVLYSEFWGHWGIAGVTKIQWRENGQVKRRMSTYSNTASADWKDSTWIILMSSDSVLTAWWRLGIDTVSNNPVANIAEDVIAGYFHRCTVAVRAGKKTACFQMSYNEMIADLHHPRSRMVRRLRSGRED